MGYQGPKLPKITVSVWNLCYADIFFSLFRNGFKSCDPMTPKQLYIVSINCPNKTLMSCVAALDSGTSSELGAHNCDELLRLYGQNIELAGKCVLLNVDSAHGCFKSEILFKKLTFF